MDNAEQYKNLPNPPIVEAIVDINCSMPPALDLHDMHIQSVFSEEYPLIEQVSFQSSPDKAGEQGINDRSEIKAIILRQKDKKQLVQVRINGFAFNRLAPYSSLDDYLIKIEQAWNLFNGITNPLLIRSVMLRYVNRIMLPVADGKCEIEAYLKIRPKWPDDCQLELRSFFNQYCAIDKESGHLATVIMAPRPVENNRLPLILDIEVEHREDHEPNDWGWIESRIQSLRVLKNRLFMNTLSEECLALFQ